LTVASASARAVSISACVGGGGGGTAASTGGGGGFFTLAPGGTPGGGVDFAEASEMLGLGLTRMRILH